MAARSKQRQASRAKRRRQESRPARQMPWRNVLIGGVVAVAIIGVGFLMWRSASQESAVDEAVATLASENAGGAEIATYTGTHHTVYHSTEPLPTAQQPRLDGRPTLVWFSGTWCEFCEQMDPFAHRTAATFGDDLVFVEKSVDHDRSAAGRYGVLGTPTFVLIDAEGDEMSRFGFQRDATSFAQAIESVLVAIGAA